LLSGGSGLAFGLRGGILGGRFYFVVFAGAGSEAFTSSSGSFPFAIEAFYSSCS